MRVARERAEDERDDEPMLREELPILLEEPEIPPVALLILAGRLETQ